MTINAVTATLVVPVNANRRFLYLENNSAVDFRWGFTSGVTMSGGTAGMLLKAGDRREWGTDNFGPISSAIYAIAASGTPDLIVVEASA